MIVITADQRGSRSSEDLVPAALQQISIIGGDRLPFAPDRNAGDEIQVATEDGRTALEIILHLVRTEEWAVGVGVGGMEEDRGTEIRAARGEAFIHARAAVERAKAAPSRFALVGAEPSAAEDAEALIRLLLELRSRRTGPGWEVFDHLAAGESQKDIAARLGISETAVSLRARAAGLRADEAAVPALARVLDRLNGVGRP